MGPISKVAVGTRAYQSGALWVGYILTHIHQTRLLSITSTLVEYLPGSDKANSILCYSINYGLRMFYGKNPL
jgi:hypothetical protein